MLTTKNKTLIDTNEHQGFIFISDIHGQLNTLKLIKQARHDYPDFILVGGGDYIDGHRYSKEVMDYLKSQTNAVILRGNHEQMLLNFANDKDDPDFGFSSYVKPLWWENGGKSTLHSLFHRNFSLKQYIQAKELLKNSEYYDLLNQLPIMYETPKIIFVHGGIHPDKNYNNPAKYPNNQDPQDDNYDQYRLWARQEYWWHQGIIHDANTGIPAKWLSSEMSYFAHNKTGKTIVTGHTPTALIHGAYDDWSIKNKHCILDKPFTKCNVLKIQYQNEPARIFTDGGCHSKYKNHWGNVVILDSHGNILKIYNYDNQTGTDFDSLTTTD